MNDTKKLLKNTGLIAIGNMGAKIMTLILLPLYTSILSTQEYGIYDYIVAISAFVIPVITLSMNDAMFRFIIENENKEKEIKHIISTSFFVQLFGVCVLFVLTIIMHHIFQSSYIYYIWIYIAANVLYMFSTYLLRGIGKVKIYSVIAFSKTAFQLVLNVVVIVVLKWGLRGMVFSLCFSEVCAFVIVFFMNGLWKHINIKYVHQDYFRNMICYSLPLIPNTLGTQIIHLSDRLIISGFMGVALNGIYSIAYKFPSVIEVIYNYFYLAWSENASQVLKRGREEAYQYYKKLHSQVDSFVFSVVIYLVAFTGLIFQIFIKGEYSTGYVYVPLLAYSMYFDCMAKFYSGIFAAFKKTKVMASSTAKAAIINLLINIFLISKIGLYAAAISTLIAEFFLYILRRKDLMEEINFGFELKREVGKVLITIILYILYSYNNPLKIFLSVVITSLFFVFYNKDLINFIIKKSKSTV